MWLQLSHVVTDVTCGHRCHMWSQLSHVVTIVTYGHNCHMHSHCCHPNFHLSSSFSSPQGHVDLTAPSSPTVIRVASASLLFLHHTAHHLAKVSWTHHPLVTQENYYYVFTLFPLIPSDAAPPLPYESYSVMSHAANLAKAVCSPATYNCALLSSIAQLPKMFMYDCKHRSDQ